MNKKTLSRILLIVAFSLSAIGGYTLVKYGIIGMIFFIAGTLVLIVKWKYVDEG